MRARNAVDAIQRTIMKKTGAIPIAAPIHRGGLGEREIASSKTLRKGDSMIFR
jgi:hypothetical protein